MSHPERKVGSYLRSSQAAERALDQGEELEDTLWMGSGRFDGSQVRRQFQKQGSRRMNPKSSRRGGFGSQRFLQSMRYLNLNHLRRRTNNNNNINTTMNRSFGSNNNNAKETEARWGRQDSQDTNHYNNSSSSTNHRRESDRSNNTTATNVLRNFGRKDSDNSHYHCNPLEYNGGKEASTRMIMGDLNTTVVNAAKKTRTTLLQASQGHDSNNNNINGSSAAHRNRRSEVTRLLSMRCEASRSMRRQRGVGQMVQWLIDEPVAATLEAGKHTAAAAVTVAADTGRRLPFRKHLHSTGREKRHHQRLTKSTLTRETAVEEEDPVRDNQKHKEGKRKHKNKDGGTKWNPLRWSKGGHDRQKKNKKKLSLSMSMESRGSSASSLMNDDDHFDMGPSSPVVPVHVQLARSQKRNDALHRGSRHLENDTNSSSDDNSNNNHSSEFGGDSGRYDPFGSGARKAMGLYHEVRSTRLDIKSNQPLLVRGRGERMSITGVIYGGTAGIEKSSSENDDSGSSGDNTGIDNRSVTAFKRKKNKKSQKMQNSNTDPQQARVAVESTRFFPPLSSEMNTNNRSARGDLLVNQFSGLSVVGCNDNSDDSDDNFYSVQELMDSTRADAAYSARSSGGEDDEDEDDGAPSSFLPVVASQTPGASYFMQNQRGFGGNQLECLEEEAEGDLTESEHRSNHYGPDQNFGRSTLDSSLSSLMKLKKNDDSASDHSQSFPIDLPHPSVAMETDSGRSPGRIGRRKTLPPNALGQRQTAMRGGSMSECAEEALQENHQRRRSSLPLEIELSSSTHSHDNSGAGASTQQSGGNKEKGGNSGAQRDTPGQNRQGESDSDGEGCEVLLQDAAIPNRDPGGTEWWQVASDDGSELRKTKVFCTKLLDDWDARMEEDANNSMTLFLGEAFDECSIRSVASEPADIGLWEPLLMLDPADSAWLFAWDDLALL